MHDKCIHCACELCAKTVNGKKFISNAGINSKFAEYEHNNSRNNHMNTVHEMNNNECRDLSYMNNS